VGAIFLVALVVVVLPWFVDNDPPPPLKDVNVILPPIPPVEQKFPGEALPPQAVTAEPLPPIGKPAADAAQSRAAIDEPAEAAPAAPPVAAAPAPLPPATAITAQGSSPRAGDRAGAQASPPGPTQPVG
jgi:cell division septation protein DedD